MSATAGGTSLKSIRGNLSCDDASEFHRTVAPSLGASGFFVPSPTPAPIGTRVSVQLRYRGGRPAVLGEAVVARHASPGKPRGMLLRLTRLDPESVQFKVVPPAPADPAQAAACLTPVLGTPIPSAAAAPVSRTLTPEGGTIAFEPDEGLLQLAGRETKDDSGLEPFDVLGSYQLLRRLGSGGMAEVYLARATLAEGVEKLVAFKTVRPQFGPDTPSGSLFLNEARISVTLQHPTIVQVFDFGEARGRPYLAMEHIHGRTLSDVLRWLRENGEPPHLGLAVAIGIEVCRALEYLHGKHDLEDRPLDLVHRDVSPSNILIAATGEVKLLDFGVASAATGRRIGDVAGKLAYMAPEQARGGAPRPSWDVFALGLVLHQLFTLERFDADDPYATPRSLGGLGQPLFPPSSTNPEVPALLDRAVLDATDPEPTRRLLGAKALRNLLQAVQVALPPVDIAQEMQRMFGPELKRERAEVQELLVRARILSPPAARFGVLGQGWRAAKRRILTSGTGTRLARRPGLVRATLLSLLLAAGAGGYLGWSALRTEASYAREVSIADERLAAGLLVGPGEDAALDHLLAAKDLKPSDPRALERLLTLAERFEAFGDAANTRGDAAEAAVHFQAALSADPGRPSARVKLRAAEEQVKAISAQQTRRAP
ncbi:MAG: serine/threonine protein kinase [Myxococcaceae bacterium]